MKTMFALGLSMAMPLMALAEPTIFNHNTITGQALITSPSAKLSATGEARTKPVVLMNLNLTTAQKQLIVKRKTKMNFSKMSHTHDTLPEQVQLGMGKVPVLDQGSHGTCVTFATTAALDAVLGKADYISQLCSLSLGRFIENNSYGESGWDGTYGATALHRFMTFGIVTSKTQHSQGCNGVKEYPTYSEYDTGKPMSAVQYHKVSENISDRVSWEQMTNMMQYFDPNYDDDQAESVIQGVKQALTTNIPDGATRVTFGVILPYMHCNMGACATFKEHEDTWAYSKEIADDEEPALGGHEMVITGYDDNAVATDSDGTKHVGLFTLRNSWGDEVGDKGNFYMSYDYFKKYAMETQRIVYDPNQF